MNERRFSRAQLLALLRHIDAELEEPVQVIVVGSGALCLTHLNDYTTKDIDFWPTRNAALAAAIGRARARMADPPAVDMPGVVQPPYDFEDRLSRLEIEGLQKLTVLVPDLHDLALMKTARGDEEDLAALEQAHRMKAFDLDRLVHAYDQTRIQYIGQPWMLKAGFLALVARLYGNDVAEDLDPKLRS